MIELFAIFGKGGLVLWCFKEGQDLFREAIDSLVSDVLLQVRCFALINMWFIYFKQRTVGVYKKDDFSIKYKLDNEFDLIFLVRFYIIFWVLGF